MAGGVKSAAYCLIVLAAVSAAAGARAQVLTDPTRPPAALSAPAATSGSPSAQDEITGTQLQSILISSSRKVAVINGTMVPLGGMVGEARVVSITETQVVLRKGEETEVLMMYPGIDKRPVKRTAARRGESK
jgi:MSHA biogenesis protein MshK